MASFSFNTAAELFSRSDPKKKRSALRVLASWHAAESVSPSRSSSLPADSLNGAYLPSR